MSDLFYRKGKPVPLPEPLAPLADTHTHLGSLKEQIVSEALTRAWQAGVRMMVVPLDPDTDFSDATDCKHKIDTWEQEGRAAINDFAQNALGMSASDICNCVQDNYNIELHYLAGVHPYGAQNYSDVYRASIDNLLSDDRFVGIGEIGLDYNAEGDPVLQQEVFREQLARARELDVPVELHLRNASNDTQALCHQDAYRILVADGIPQAGCVLHCFTATPEVMRSFVELGCYIAFGGAATFKSAPYIREAFLECPEHLILSETDAPYMAPVPLRGKSCEPAMIAFIVAALADLAQEAGIRSRQATYDAFWNNAQRLFVR